MVVVVVNELMDEGSVVRDLKDAGLLESEWLKIIGHNYSGKAWSKELNLGLNLAKVHNLSSEAKGREKFKYVINFSVETLFEPVHVEAALNSFTKYENAGVIGTSFLAKKYLTDENVIKLGRSYNHPRNTFMAINIERLGHFWWSFNIELDEKRGMEDLYFIFEMLLHTGLDSVMLDLQIPLIVGAHYNQGVKQENEEEAMRGIVKHFRSLFKNVITDTGKEILSSIEAVIAEMRLED